MTREEAVHIVDVAFDIPVAVRRDGEDRTYHEDEISEAKDMAIKALKQETRKGYLSIDDVMSVFDDFMCGEVDEEGTEIFLKMLKNRAESEDKQ